MYKGLHSGLNILAIVFAMIGAILCIMTFFTSNKSNSYRFGLSVDQAYSVSTNLFIMSLVIWTGLWYNIRVIDRAFSIDKYVHA
jgi:hypothetical protein